VRLRHVLVLAAAVGGGLLAGAPAWAHSPTDFLKVSVGGQSTILLPPMTTLPGRMEVTISAPPAFRLTAVAAGPGWQTRVAPTAAVLDGRAAAGHSLLVTVTGTASRAGRLPLDVRLSSPAAPTQTYHWRVTALAGYSQPVSSLAGASQPDAPVAVGAAHGHRLWPVSVVLAMAALLVLVVRRPRPLRRP
jgi:hypothetical protein